MSVTLIERPAAIESSIAPSPGIVAGIFTKRFGRSTSSWSRVACSNVRLAVVRELGIDLERDEPVDAVRPLPDGPQEIARALDVLDREREEDLLRVVLALELARGAARRTSAPVDSAFSKIVGFDVTPTTASSSISRSSSPVSSISRERESTQTLTPCVATARAVGCAPRVNVTAGRDATVEWPA